MIQSDAARRWAGQQAGHYWIRAMSVNDTRGALRLMQELARFEGYAEEFAITESDLLKHGFGPDRLFEAIVAEDIRQQRLCGVAVTYRIPWTYTGRPAVVLKELYVDESTRGQGVGRLLLRAVARLTVACGADQLRWTVLRNNETAMRFYQSLGGVLDEPWVGWRMDLAALQELT